jgi:hypothetical protein
MFSKIFKSIENAFICKAFFRGMLVGSVMVATFMTSFSIVF